jgi:hypothetical protein
VSPFSFVDGYQCFRVEASLKHGYLFAKLLGITSLKTILMVGIVVVAYGGAKKEYG